MTCPLDSQRKIPSSVSLVISPCFEAKNNLKIIDRQPSGGKKREFGVCMNQISTTRRDFIVRFVEWVRMLEILGASKIHGTIHSAHYDSWKVWKFLALKDLFEFTSFTLPNGDDYNDYWSQQDVRQNFLNDCFHKNKNLYKFIIILDSDEMILPLYESDMNWNDMMRRFGNVDNKDFFYFSYVNFPRYQENFTGIPITTCCVMSK